VGDGKQGLFGLFGLFFVSGRFPENKEEENIHHAIRGAMEVVSPLPSC
jgi:hypothetical protein